MDERCSLEKQFWYNTKTNAVEEGPQSLSLDRIGPFATHAEAQRAPEIVAEKARKLREEEQLRDEWD